MGKNTSSKSLIVFSDIHVGSKYSVCSPETTLDAGGSYRASENQKKLYDGWCSCIDEISQRASALIVNGEPIDGDNKRTSGDSVWSTNLIDQLDDVEKLFSMIKYDNLYVTRGSSYHTQKDGTNFEQIFAKHMGANKYKSIMGNVTRADYEANIEIFNKHINFTHHVGYSGWWMYRPTPIARELVKMHFQHRENGFHTDVLVRSHVHYYVEVRFPHTKGLSTPAWKFPDGFMYRHGEPELPTIGNIEIIIESNGKIQIEPHLIDVEFKKSVIHL